MQVLLKLLYDSEELIKNNAELLAKYSTLTKVKRSSSLYSLSNDEQNLCQEVKNFIEDIEDNEYPGGEELLKHYLDIGVYKMLYHNPIVRGQNYEISMLSILISLAIVTLCVAFFAIVSFIGLSGGWIIAGTALLGGAFAYMCGILYGIVNDMFATRYNLPYFLLGHQSHQATFFLSNDPNVQAIGWGVIALEPLAIIAGIIFTIVIASVMAATSSAAVTFVLPLMMAMIPVLALCAEGYSRYSTNEIKQDLNKYTIGNNSYQEEALKIMCPSPDSKAKWLGNSDRNLFGYFCAPLLGVTGLVLTLTLTGLPTIFFSTLLSTIIPIAAAASAIVILALAMSYFFVNRDHQIDNRYKITDDKCSRFSGGFYTITSQIFQNKLCLSKEDSTKYTEKELQPVLDMTM